MRLFIIAIAAALTGCGGVDAFEAQLATDLAASETRIKSLIGHPVDAAISQFGYPAGERTVADRRLIHWTRGMPNGVDPISCTLTYEVDAARVIKAYQIEGNQGACIF